MNRVQLKGQFDSFDVVNRVSDFKIFIMQKLFQAITENWP